MPRATYCIVRLAPAEMADDHGVYSSHETNTWGTPLMFRGTREECEAAYMERTRNETPWFVIHKRRKVAAKRAARRAAGVGG